MSKIYITGHRNPDMDSLCSALAYANLKNLIDPMNEYIPVRCSHLGVNTKKLLQQLSITAPEYMRNAYPKVADVMLSTGQQIDAAAPVTEYARSYKESNPSAVPVFDGEEFIGLITVDDIAMWAVKQLQVNDGIRDIPTVREIMNAQDKPLQAEDRFEDAKKQLIDYRKRGLAVFDGDKYAGYVTRRCFLNTPRYKFILVDHNETTQSIKGIEDADVIEIIDHHRLNALKTDLPLFIDAEPLGSTCTIVYQLYLRNGIRPDRNTARIMLTGIITDTLILKSPTTTETDIQSARFLAAICGVDLESYGREIFSGIDGPESAEPQAAITSDFKVYEEQGVRIGIGQCEATTLNNLSSYCGRYLEALDKVKSDNRLDWAMVMITDVVNEHSVLLSSSFSAEGQLQFAQREAHVYDMPGVMSRKKQLLPEIIHSVGMAER